MRLWCGIWVEVSETNKWYQTIFEWHVCDLTPFWNTRSAHSVHQRIWKTCLGTWGSILSDKLTRLTHDATSWPLWTKHQWNGHLWKVKVDFHLSSSVSLRIAWIQTHLRQEFHLLLDLLSLLLLNFHSCRCCWCSFMREGRGLVVNFQSERLNTAVIAD